MGKVAEIKTKETDLSVDVFINSIENEQERNDCHELVRLMEKATKAQPKIWGSSIIGFGNKRYKSPTSGREVDWFIIGFAPRKANITLYLTTALHSQSPLLQKLGKHKTGGGCLYINKLDDVDQKVLAQMIKEAAVENANKS